ncbi:MAG: AIR synthase-related protein [Halobacteriaceae archaeon]
MDEIGKVDREVLARTVYDRVGASRTDVALGPGHGLDFGVVTVGDNAVAMAADPVFVPLSLGVDRAAWYAVHIVLSDVALSGLAPTHLAVTITLPAGADLDTFERVWTRFHEAAATEDVAIATGHTGRYEGCAYPYIGGATAMAVGDPEDLIVPSGASPGDAVLVTQGPAVETVGVLATRFGDRLTVDEATVAAAKDRFWEIGVVDDARVAASTGAVTAMHDATERGIDNALHELAAAADVELVVERAAFPVGDGVEAVCSALDIDPWTASSEGTVVLTVAEDDVEAVLDAFAAADIRAARVGSVQAGAGVRVDGDPMPEPESDPFWVAYTRLADGE